MCVLGTLTRGGVFFFFKDEQVALKKKLKETLEGEVGCFWAKPHNNKAHKEKVETLDPDKVRLSIKTNEHTASTALVQSCSNSYKILLYETSLRGHFKHFHGMNC